MNGNPGSTYAKTGYCANGRGHYKKTGLLSNKEPALESPSQDGYVADIQHHSKLPNKKQ